MRYVAYYDVESDDAQIPFTAKDREDAIQKAKTEVMEQFREGLKKDQPHLAGKEIILRKIMQKAKIGPFSQGTQIFPLIFFIS